MEYHRIKFEIHHVVIEFIIDDSRLSDIITDYLSYYASKIDRAPDITFSFICRDEPWANVPGDSHWFFNYHGIAGLSHKNIFFYVCGAAVLVFDPEKMTVEGNITEHLISIPRTLTHQFINVILMETLRYRNLYYLHAAALEGPGGESIMITGESCVGKTTLTLSLMKNGWKWLSDDTILLRNNGGGKTELLPFTRNFHVPPDLACKIEELKFLLDAPEYFPNNSKRALRVEDCYGACVTLLKCPDVVLFPIVAVELESRVEPVNTLDGLNEIIRSSPYVMFSQKPAKAHLEALKAVVQNARCYRLFSGRDVAENPVAAAARIIGLVF